MPKHELREMRIGNVFLGHYIQGNTAWMGGYKYDYQSRYNPKVSGFQTKRVRVKEDGHPQTPRVVGRWLGQKPGTKQVPWIDGETVRMIRAGELRVSGALTGLVEEALTNG